MNSDKHSHYTESSSWRRERRRTFVAGVTAMIGFCCLVATLDVARAQSTSYPSRPIKLVVPYAAGGSADVIGRILGQGLSARTGQPVVVENRPGAGGHIGTEYMLGQPADGYTLVLATIAHNGAFKMYRNLRYNPPVDLMPVVLIAESPNVLLVRNSLPVKSVAELVAMARAAPGKLNYGSAGIGSATHIAGELFKYLTKVDIVMIPFSGGAPALAALLGEQVDITFETGSTAQQALRTGKVRALAVTTAERSTFYPDLPTVAEAGVPGYAAAPWYTISVARRTPPQIVQKLNLELNAVIASPDVAPRWQALGITPIGGTPESAARRNDVETKRWTTLIDAAQIVAD